MRVDIVTIFPEALAPLDLSILGRARERGLLEIVVWDLREFTTDRHRQVDDTPYGGGAGMVLKPEPFFAAVDSIAEDQRGPILLMTPQGYPFKQSLAEQLSAESNITIICGHYEGFDERIRSLATHEVSME